MIYPTRATPRRPAIATVELAVAFILLVPALIGAWEVGRLVEVQQMLDNAAREGARQAACGNITLTQVQTDVVTYMGVCGVTCTASNVTFSDFTTTTVTDPSNAKQLDHMQVKIQIPFDSVRWIILGKITNTQTLTATADWYSMQDLPLTVQTTIPIN